MPQTKRTNFEQLKDLVESCKADDLTKPWSDYPCVEWPKTIWIKCNPVGTKIVGRIAYILRHGSIPEDHAIYRRCSNVKCIRPVHLHPVNVRALLRELLANIPNDPNQCMEWPLSRDKLNYGRITGSSGTRVEFVHRAAWEIVHGPIPDGMFVCHDCPNGDNPACFRPSHMFLGSAADNQADSKKKGTAVRGERVGTSKLNAEEVKEIRRLRQRGVEQKQIGKRFGVTQSTISEIVRRKKWRWLE
jgi:predicted XRE-type DNA-binding protein